MGSVRKKESYFGLVTRYELTHFKKMVRVWKTKSLVFCLRYDPLIVWKTNRRCRYFVFEVPLSEWQQNRNKGDLTHGKNWVVYSILCSVAILKACTMIQSMITSATKTSWRNNVIPTNMFSSSSYRVLSQSFCPQNISLLPKAWFPYDRPDRPDIVPVVSKMFRRSGRSYGNATQTIANHPDDWDDVDRLDRVEFYPDDRDDHESFEAIIWKRSQTTETIGTIEGYPRRHHLYFSNRE